MEETTTQIIQRRLKVLFANEEIPLDPKLAMIAIKIEELQLKQQGEEDIDDTEAEYA